ncbi:hypothetical protein D8674_022552 [Pyrus ussuriensis x Pyrus communis]|uniref:Phosphotyrosine protein phosphatase domain-containing protein n=1 Tax=Pyrus ussuriensis x Pyrus communis TaxID=2448454 RepID=A0A5N5GYX2_9ROSA|nr:hypothetical protein D8674_022552 [Pyrus ussuriensis x Pyrus communis]
MNLWRRVLKSFEVGVGDFAIDNRAGISRTLHRITGIRNRKGVIIGLTCRVGRAISGSAVLLRDLVQDGGSLLLIGPPGVGKTTMIGMNYITMQLAIDLVVLIEAVENHMPQVIVIDETGTKLEALAASKIAQHGIQLVATAHGVTIENLIMSPSLEMLVGRIQSVTLGDEEANRRGVQKTVQERKGPATFSCGVEIISGDELRVHSSLETTGDAILSGMLLWKSQFFVFLSSFSKLILKSCSLDEEDEDVVAMADKGSGNIDFNPEILEASVIQVIKQLKMDEAAAQLTDDIRRADALLALQSKLKKNPPLQAVAKSYEAPVYVTKSNSLMEIRKAVRALISDHKDGLRDYGSVENLKSSEKIDALDGTFPRPSHIMSPQMDLIRKYQLEAERISKEPDVSPYPSISYYSESVAEENHARLASERIDANDVLDDFLGTNGSTNGSLSIVDRLPLLPE